MAHRFTARNLEIVANASDEVLVYIIETALSVELGLMDIIVIRINQMNSFTVKFQ